MPRPGHTCSAAASPISRSGRPESTSTTARPTSAPLTVPTTGCTRARWGHGVAGPHPRRSARPDEATRPDGLLSVGDSWPTRNHQGRSGFGGSREFRRGGRLAVAVRAACPRRMIPRPGAVGFWMKRRRLSGSRHWVVWAGTESSSDSDPECLSYLGKIGYREERSLLGGVLCRWPRPSGDLHVARRLVHDRATHVSRMGILRCT